MFNKLICSNAHLSELTCKIDNNRSSPSLLRHLLLKGRCDRYVQEPYVVSFVHVVNAVVRMLGARLHCSRSVSEQCSMRPRQSTLDGLMAMVPTVFGLMGGGLACAIEPLQLEYQLSAVRTWTYDEGQLGLSVVHLYGLVVVNSNLCRAQ